MQILPKKEAKVKKICKRSGQIVDFDKDKITQAISKALEATETENAQKLAEKLSDRVIEMMNKKFHERTIPAVEEIQDLVEEALVEDGLTATIRAYILYREQHKQLRDYKVFIDSDKIMEGYLNQLDWRVKENSNMAYSLQGLNNHVASAVSTHYWLNKIYPPEIREAHIEGDFHIHDLYMLAAYCTGWDLKDLLIRGFGGVGGKIQCAAPKHLRSALGQIVNFFYTLQGEIAGAVAFSNFDTYLAPFIRYDRLDYAQVKQAMQEFLFNMNVPTRVGFQCVSFDTEILSKDGWMRYDQVKEGDIIATFNVQKGFIEYLPVRRVFAKEYKGKMYSLKNRISDQLISPGHRVVRKKFDAESYTLEKIEKVLALKLPFIVPVGSDGNVGGIDSANEELLKFIAWVVSGGSLDKSGRDAGRISIYQSKIKDPASCEEIISLCQALKLKYAERTQKVLGKDCNVIRFDADSSRKILTYFKSDKNKGIKFIPEYILNAGAETARLFLETYIKRGGHGECKITAASEAIKDGLLQIAVNAGYGATVLARKPDNELSEEDKYIIRIIKHKDTRINEVKQVDYKGIIWCPNTDNETVVARRNGKIFITGNTPFTNVTLDLKIPGMIKDEPVILGGKPEKEKYGEFQKEMDMFNKAFAEVMMAGDASARVFTFPIPTYNITKDFDWDSEVTNKIFEMTAKYGTPYFCLDENTEVVTKNGIKKIKDIKLNDEMLNEQGGFNSVSLKKRMRFLENVQLRGDDFEIICSKNHKFPTNNGLKTAIELSLQDKLLRFTEELILENGMRLNFMTSQFFNLTTDLAILSKEKFITLKPKKKIKKIDSYTFVKNRFQTTFNEDIKIPNDLDEELMELIGIILGDGNLRGDGVRIANADEEIISFVKKVMKSKFNLQGQIRQAGRSNIHKEILFNSAILTNFLEFIGLQGRTPAKRIPEVCYWRPEKEMGALLRGLFDSDGSLTLNRRGDHIVSIDFSNKKLVNDTLLLLAKLGIVGKLISKQRICVTGGRNINLFAKLVGFRIKRKQSLLNYPVKQTDKPSVGDKIVSNKEAIKFSQRYLYKNHEFVRVKSDNIEPHLFVDSYQKNITAIDLKEIGIEKEQRVMYDITVDSKKHLFVLKSGVISHNSNFVNSDMNPDDARSMCCRLRLDNRELRKRGGGLFGANPLTGSIGVVTLNMSRLGYLARKEGNGNGDKAKEHYFDKLEKLMKLARQSLEIKREGLEKFTEEGLYPYCRYYLDSIKKRFGEYWRNHFNTIGINGMNESLLNFMGKTIAEPEGNKFAAEILDFMREKLMDYQLETNNLYNLEATPAEGACYRLARTDKKEFPDIIVANEEAVRTRGAEPYYTNSTQLPVDYTDDIFEALSLEDDLQTKYTGGTVVHGFIGEKMPDIESTKNLAKKIAHSYRLPYYTLTPTFSICQDHGYIVGEHWNCPECGKEAEVYSRVVGYLRPVQQWNNGKRAEFEHRKEFKVKKV